MADNRLYLFCPETGEELMLAKAHGFSWISAKEEINQDIAGFLDRCMDNEFNMRKIELRQENSEGYCAVPLVGEL